MPSILPWAEQESPQASLDQHDHHVPTTLGLSRPTSIIRLASPSPYSLEYSFQLLPSQRCTDSEPCHPGVGRETAGTCQATFPGSSFLLAARNLCTAVEEVLELTGRLPKGLNMRLARLRGRGGEGGITRSLEWRGEEASEKLPKQLQLQRASIHQYRCE